MGIVFYLFCIFFFTYAFYSWRSEETEVVIGINDSQAEIVFENNGLVNAENIGPVLSYLDGANGGFTATNELNRTIEINIRLRTLSISDNLVNEDFKYVLLKSEDGGTNYDVEVASGDFTSLQVGMNLLAIDTIPAGAIYAYKLYVYIDGDCSTNSDAWAMGDSDFYYMTRGINGGYGKRLTEGSSTLGDVGGSTLGDKLYCDSSSVDECGLGNDLINNGGFYWFASPYSFSTDEGVAWSSSNNYVYGYTGSTSQQVQQ